MAKNSKTTIPDGPEIARLMGKGAMYGLILFTIVVVGIDDSNNLLKQDGTSTMR